MGGCLKDLRPRCRRKWGMLLCKHRRMGSGAPPPPIPLTQSPWQVPPSPFPFALCPLLVTHAVHKRDGMSMRYPVFLPCPNCLTPTPRIAFRRSFGLIKLNPPPSYQHALCTVSEGHSFLRILDRLVLSWHQKSALHLDRVHATNC